MKKIILAILLCTNLLLTPLSFAGNWDQSIQAINSAQQQQNWFGVYQQSVELIDQVYGELDVDSVVASLNTEMTEMRKEVITERHRTKSRWGLEAAFSLLFLISGEGSMTSKERKNWDVSKIITTNPEQVSQFDGRVQNDFTRLQNQLNDYVQSHSSDIVLLKEAGLKAFEAATKLMQEGYDISIQELNNIQTKVSGLSFKGVQRITQCVQVKHARRKYFHSSSSSSALDINAFFFSFSFGAADKQKTKIKYLPYTEKSCRSSQNVVNMDVSSEYINVNIAQLDRNLDSLANFALATNLFNITPIAVPTFGNPYFQD